MLARGLIPGLLILHLTLGFSGCVGDDAAESSAGIPLRGPWFSQDSTRDHALADRCVSPTWRAVRDLRRLMPPADQHFYVWYCTNYTIPANVAGDHALNLGVIGDLDVVYVDGVQLGSHGSAPGYTPVGIHLYRSYRMWRRSLVPGAHTLEIRVLQTDVASGAIAQQQEIAILPARQSELKAWRHNFFRTDLPFALAVAVLVVGCYYWMLALTEKREKRFFYFSAMCTCVAICLGTFSYRFTVLIANAAWEWKIGAISCFWVIHFLVAFIHESEGRAKGRLHRAGLIVAAVATVLEFVSPDVQTAGLVNALWVPWLFAMQFYVGVVFFRAWRRSPTRELTWILCAYVPFAFSGTYDFVISFVDPAGYILSPYGYVLFTMSLNILLAREHGNALVDSRKKVVLEAQVQQLRTLTDIDSLTTLYNRRSFFEHLERQFAAAKNGGTGFALLILDIDHFKRFNDAHGHPEGDKLLRTFSDVLTRAVREGDVVGRIGGEEFGIVLTNVQGGIAQVLAEQVRIAIERCPDMRAQRDGTHVTTSIGIAEQRQETPSVATLYEQADAALYVAKRVRNSTMRFSLIPTEQDLKRLSMRPSRSSDSGPR